MKNIYRWIRNGIGGKFTKTHASWLLAALTPAAYALPPQGTVTAGSATITNPNSSQLVIDQTTTKAIIDWNSFSVAHDESVQFNTPGANAATLNRVIGRDPSQIFGTVSSNGQLWLINSNGILFGRDSQVNVAGLLASTLDISNADFLSGNYQFNNAGATYGSVINHGHLNADGGYIALLAPQIINTGFATARLGTVALGAGTRATLTLEGNKLLSFEIGAGAEVPMYDGSGKPIAALSQSGTVTADGGQVLLVAKSIDTLLNQSINVSGVLQANSVETRNGKIVLLAEGDAVVDDARLSAQGLGANETGGKVEVIGRNVGLFGTTSIDASGDAGGGEIRIGRDDTDSRAFEANVTAITPDVHLVAEATRTGNGGLVETSGYTLNLQTSHVSTRATNGKWGTWLLDPYNVTISNSSNNNVNGSTPFKPTGSSSNLNVTTLQVGLATSNVVIQTGLDSGVGNGDITVNNDVAWSSGNSLTLNAAGSIVLNAALIGTSDATSGGTPNATVNLSSQYGSITDNAGIGKIIAANTTLSAGTSASDASSYISLVNAGNNLGTLSAVAYGTDGGGNSITVNDGSTSGLVLGNISSPGNLAITASGNVTQNAGTGIDMSSGTGGAATATFNIAGSQSGSITLTNSANDFNQNTVRSAGSGLVTSFSLYDSDGSGTYLGDVNAGDSTHTANVSVIAQHGFNQLSGTTVASHGGDVTFKTIAGGSEIHQYGAVQSGGGRVLLEFNYSGTVSQNTTGSIDTSDGIGNYGLVEVRSDGYGYSMEADLNNAANENNFQQIAFENIAGHAMQVNATINNNNSLAFGLFYDTAPTGGADFFNQLTIDTNSANGSVTTLSTAGPYTAEALTVTSNPVNIGAGTGNIVLSGSDNDFGNQTVNLYGGVVQITDHNATGLVLGAVDATTLNAMSDSGLALTSYIAATGNVSLTANNVTTNTGVLDFAGHPIIVGTNTLTLNNPSTAIGHTTTALNLGAITSGTLNLVTAGGAINQGGGIISATGTNLTTNGGNVLLNSLANTYGTITGSGSLGAVTIARGGSLTFGAMSASSLNATGAGALTQSGALIISGTTTLDVGSSKNITLSNASNDFGTLRITSAKDAVIVDSNAITLGASTVSGTFNLTTAGAITQSGALTMTGIATLNAGSQSITLTNVNNSFSTLGLTGGNANIVNAGAIALGAVQANALTLTTGGNITKANSGVAITVSGTAALNAGSTHDITLNGTNNNFGTVSISSGRNVTLTDTNGLIFGTSTISGSLNVTTNGAMTQSGALSVVGNSTLNAGTQSITLTNSSNNLGHGVVTLSGSDITLLDTNSTGLLLGNVNASGNINIATDHSGQSPDLTQSSGVAITMTGTDKTANFNVGNGTGQVLLANAANNFNGNRVNAGQIGGNAVDNVSIVDASGNTLSIGAINSSGDIALGAAGAIVQTSDGEINNVGLLTAQSADGVTLVGDGNNQFGRVSALSGSNQDITITSASGIVIQNAINAGAGTVTLTATGNHSIADYDANAMIIAGTTNLSAGSTLDDVDAFIDLSNANQFGTINAVAYGASGSHGVALVDGNANGLTLHTVSNYAADADLRVTTSGPLLLTGNITTTSISLSATDTTNGYIQQTAGTMTVSGTSSFEAYGARVVSNPPYPNAYVGIDLLENYDSSNQFGALSMISHYDGASAQANGVGASNVSGSTTNGLFNVQIKNGTLTVGNSGISSGSGMTLLSINGSGNIALNGNVSASGGLILNANGGTITQQVGTTLSGPVSMSSASTATLVNTGALDLGTVAVTNLSVTADNHITQSGALTIPGTTALDAGTHTITLNRPDNAFGGTITVGHSGITAGAIDLQSGSGDIVLSQVDQNANTKLSSLSVNTVGSISQSGALNVASDTQLTAGSAITLTNTNNDFGNHAVSATGGAIQIVDANATGLTLGPISASSLSATANGSVVGTSVLSVSGPVTVTSGGNISIDGPNQIHGVVTLNGHDILFCNIVDSIFGNVTAGGNFDAALFANGTQAANTAFHIAGITNINGESNDVALSNSNNLFGGAVTLTGNNLRLTQQSGQDLTLNIVNGYGDIVIDDAGGTLTFAGSAPNLSLRNGFSGGTITLISDHFANQNTGAVSPIDLGTGSGNAWHFYLANLEGNTFSSGSNTLASGDQAIWNTSYPTAISQSGNRYIFATSQTLNLNPIANSMDLVATTGAGTTLPTPVAGTNYSLSGVVNASNYGGAFTQDTAANLFGSLSFASAGSSMSAAAGTYDITLSTPTTTATGYAVVKHDPYGTITISAPSNNPPSSTPPNTPTPTPPVSSPPSTPTVPSVPLAIGTTFNVDAATATKGVETSLSISKPLTRDDIESMSSGVNRNLHNID